MNVTNVANGRRDNTRKKIAALYVRTSTADKQDTAGQEHELRVMTESRGWQIFKVYRDHGYSGAKASRPAFDQMWSDCRRGKIQVVCVWAIDRFGRSLKNLIDSLEELHRLGIDFVSLKQDLDSTSPSGKLLFQLLGAFAEFEHQLIRSRIVSGMAAARAKGRHVGRPALRGFTKSEQEQIRAARKNERASIRQLAIRFGTTQFMVRRILGGRHETS
jgi:DNA invertase Pin-like site-specific DNA recombinase